MLLHAGEFHHAAELDLAPLPAAGRLAQRFDQLAGLALQAELTLGERFHLGPQLGVGAFAGFLDLADAALELAERFGDRLHQVFDRHPALLEFALRVLGVRFQRRLGELEELLRGGFQGIGGQRLEGVGKPQLGAVEQRLLLRRRLAFLFQPGSQLGELGPQRLAVCLVLRGFRSARGVACLQFGQAALLGFDPLFQPCTASGQGEDGDQPAEKGSGKGAEDPGKGGGEFG